MDCAARSAHRVDYNHVLLVAITNCSESGSLVGLEALYLDHTKSSKLGSVGIIRSIESDQPVQVFFGEPGDSASVIVLSVVL